jgi:hypothetical protein
MDDIDTAAVYGVVGGIITAGINWGARGMPKLERRMYLKYIALFAAMGCLGGALAVTLVNGSYSSTSAGFLGGMFGSYLLLGIGNYM